MHCYILNIAGYKIRIESADQGLDLVPSERFAGNICSAEGYDLLIKVHSEGYRLPAVAERVFHAPLIEELDGSRIRKNDEFWSIYRHGSDLFIKTIFPYSGSARKAILIFTLTSIEWDLYLDGIASVTDPLDYPLDGLILYYLTAIRGDIMIHASGINCEGKGYIFSGVSGKGKTTISRLWNEAGCRVIHDDRLIIRRVGNRYSMFNTPVYKNDLPSDSVISAIFLIGHGSENQIVPLNGAASVSSLLANCIQHNWNPELIERLIGSVSKLSSEIPVARLFFKPDRQIIDFIRNYE